MMTTEATITPTEPEPAGTISPAEPEPKPTMTSPTGDTEPDTFPRDYVEKLRAETAKYRTRAAHADVLAERLLAATVREATADLLADPSDLPLDDDLVDDDGLPDLDKIKDAAKALVARKPHLARRRPVGDVGQGARTEAAPTSLVELLRGTA